MKTDRDIFMVKIVDFSDVTVNNESCVSVEVYLDGYYDYDLSKIFPISGEIDKFRALELARHYVITELMTNAKISI